jgi:opacity protein-like surface antigen
LLSILAVLAAALMPLAATAQVDQESGSATPGKPAPTYKYQAYVGYGYTSINMVNQARHGLQGGEASITRDWGAHFGITADGGYYKLGLGGVNPGNPSLAMAFLGPEYHLVIWGPLSGYFHGLMGVEHTSGENQSPVISFAGGLGGGMDWALGQHFAIRASGDDIASSFSVTFPQPGDSPHMTRSSRASFGLVYKF